MTQGPSQPEKKPGRRVARRLHPGRPVRYLGRGRDGGRAHVPPAGSLHATRRDDPAFSSFSGSESQPFHAHPSEMDAADDSIGFQGTLQPGQVLFGRYLAENSWAKGMGTVWLVKHLELDTLRAPS